MKFDSSNALAWAFPIESTGMNTYCNDLAIDPAGNLWWAFSYNCLTDETDETNEVETEIPDSREMLFTNLGKISAGTK